MTSFNGFSHDSKVVCNSASNEELLFVTGVISLKAAAES